MALFLGFPHRPGPDSGATPHALCNAGAESGCDPARLQPRQRRTSDPLQEQPPDPRPGGHGPRQLLSHSITYRIALGSRAGQKAFTLRSLPGTPLLQPSKPFLATAERFTSKAVSPTCRRAGQPEHEPTRERRIIAECVSLTIRCSTPAHCRSTCWRGKPTTGLPRGINLNSIDP